MRQKPGTAKPTAESMVKYIRRRTRKHHSAEEKIRIVLDGLRGEDSIAERCRRKGIPTSLYYNWSKEFLEAGKKRLAGDTVNHPGSVGHLKLHFTRPYRGRRRERASHRRGKRDVRHPGAVEAGMLARGEARGASDRPRPGHYAGRDLHHRPRRRWLRARPGCPLR